MPLRIGITVGDPAGVGPEIIERALASAQVADSADFKIIGDRTAAKPGEPTRRSAEAALAAMEQAAQLANENAIDAIVTGPIHKARMIEIGFRFPGQTEFFAARSATSNYAMLLTSPVITVALVTSHIALRQVPNALTTPEIVRVGQLVAQFLHRRGLSSPRIAVAGLNPHAGESGKIGTEEVEIIAPAIQQLQSTFGNRRSAVFSGPDSPDTVFHRAANGEFDAVLCMYHDQGLIPLKLHGFDHGVNVTLGLPYPRTSPDHGTAFEIAGTNLARPDSMIAAIKLATELSTRWK